MAMADDPEWCVDMFNHMLDMSIALLDMAWDEGYTFDAVRWPDDMGYKRNQFFSLAMYRNLLDGTFKATVLTGKTPSSFNDKEHPDRVSPEKLELMGRKGIIQLPPHSLMIVHVES